MGANGYVWWYLDALSADGTRGLTVIAFIGSVFSPYYALARARGRGDPEHHVCFNVALYNPRRWAMTERGRGALVRDASHLAIGASGLDWDGTTLTVTIDETTFPVPRRVRGTVTVRPCGLNPQAFAIDAQGRHLWRPIAPRCDVEVALSSPDLAWTGTGYFDTNAGVEPLEDAFRDWTWSRFDMGEGARIFYDTTLRDGSHRSLSLSVVDGVATPAAPLAHAPMPPTFWRMPRSAPGTPQLLRTLEDAPFYSRSALRSRIDGQEALGVNESIALPRLTAPLVRAMLPFKMPRRPG